MSKMLHTMNFSAYTFRLVFLLGWYSAYTFRLVFLLGWYWPGRMIQRMHTGFWLGDLLENGHLEDKRTREESEI
jgi:hypothetical protein